MSAPQSVVVDTNVVVAGLLTRDPASPTARVLDGMLAARFVFVLSEALLAEYRRVLLRPRIRERHGLSEAEVDALLAEIVRNAAVREPAGSVGSPRPRSEEAPDRHDQHLWDLLACEPGSVLVTGDAELLGGAREARVASPRGFVG